MSTHRFAEQQAKVLVHMRKHGSITSLQAFDMTPPITRLADIKYKLNKKLKDERVECELLWNGKTHYGKYYLVKT